MVIHDQQISTKKLDTPRWYGTGKVLSIALITQLLSWYLQIHPGHHHLEVNYNYMQFTFRRAETFFSNTHTGLKTSYINIHWFHHD